MGIFGSKEDYITWIPFIVVSLIIIIVILIVQMLIAGYMYNKIKCEYSKYKDTLHNLSKIMKKSKKSSLPSILSTLVATMVATGNSLIQNNKEEINKIGSGIIKRVSDIVTPKSKETILDYTEINY